MKRRLHYSGTLHCLKLKWNINIKILNGNSNNVCIANETSEQQIMHHVAMIKQYPRFEQRILFPLIEQSMNVIELEKTGVQLAAFHEVQPDENYTDTLWIVKK